MARKILIAESVAELQQLLTDGKIPEIGQIALSMNGMDWRCIEHTEENGVVLMMAAAYDWRPFARPDKKHPWGWNNYEASQIRKELNSEVLADLFGDEQDHLVYWHPGMGKLFLLSEEAGPIPFAVRKKLVREGTADLENVILHDSGPYIISSATFPSYFLRDEDAAILAHAELDLAVFAKIAQTLGLSSRYAGEERSSHVTALYNETMARMLPEAGLRFCEIPRLGVGGETVSASTVRQAIHDGELERFRHLLPETTYRYFTSAEAAPVVAAIRAMPDPRHY